MGRAARTFGDSLKGWLTGRGVSQEDLARRVGTTQATISRYVDGTQYPTLPFAVRLHAVTGIPLTAMARPRRRDSRT